MSIARRPATRAAPSDRAAAASALRRWAADGQCKSNPGYMHDSCKYSCWEWRARASSARHHLPGRHSDPAAARFEHRRKAYPDAPIDKNFHCHNWAAKGECLSNRAFMTTTCPESCKDKYEDEKDEPPSKPPARTAHRALAGPPPGHREDGRHHPRCIASPVLRAAVL